MFFGSGTQSQGPGTSILTGGGSPSGNIRTWHGPSSNSEAGAVAAQYSVNGAGFYSENSLSYTEDLMFDSNPSTFWHSLF